MATDKWDQKSANNVPPGMKKEFLSFIKSIASFKGDLSSFTAPTFICSTTSLSEYPSYWAEQPERFVAPALEPDPQKRALLVLTWYLSTLKQQYDHRKDRRKGKPLNPVLGELFLGTFENSSLGPTEVISEQVCHHPPVTAYHIRNDDNGIRMSGYHAAKTFFANRMIHMHKIGHAVLHIDEYDEDHLLTFPQLHLEGFIPPPPYMELDEEPVYIQSSSGFVTKINFSGKGWLRGKRNSLSASVYREGKETEPLYTATGQWSGNFVITDAKSGEVIEAYDATSSDEILTPLTLAPSAKQDPMESRKLWGEFAKRMEERDMSAAGAEKNRIEVRQRQMRQEEEKEGRTWERRYFSKTDVNSKVEAMLDKLGLQVQTELTGGHWQFDKHKYQADKKGDHPTHGQEK